MTSDGFDVAVVGAGIVGASSALQLAERGLRVVVLEKEPAPGMGSTGKSAAGVRVQFTTEANVCLSRWSIDYYRELQDRGGHDVGYRPIGYLLLVPPDRWDAHLEAVALQRRLGVPVEVVEPGDVTRWVPCDTAGLAGATFGPADGVVDPHLATQAFVALGRGRGVEYRCETPVEAIARAGAGWRLDTPAGAVEARHVVNAAGAWAGRVAGLAGLALPVVPVRRQVYLTAPIDDPRTYPLTIDLATGFYLRSEGPRVLFGMSNEDEAPGFVEGMDDAWIERVLETGVVRFPWFEDTGIDLKQSWWGYYEVTPDHNPILGRHPDAEGWIDACGFSGHGIMHAPATGRIVAELVVDGAVGSFGVEPFGHGRFALGAAGDANIF